MSDEKLPPGGDGSPRLPNLIPPFREGVTNKLTGEVSYPSLMHAVKKITKVPREHPGPEDRAPTPTQAPHTLPRQISVQECVFMAFFDFVDQNSTL